MEIILYIKLPTKQETIFATFANNFPVGQFLRKAASVSV
jgi:hypothetical protein